MIPRKKRIRGRALARRLVGAAITTAGHEVLETRPVTWARLWGQIVDEAESLSPFTTLPHSLSVGLPMR